MVPPLPSGSQISQLATKAATLVRANHHGQNNLLAAIVTSAGTTLVAIIAILTNNKRFDSIEHRIDRMEQTLNAIQADFKEFYKSIAKINAKIGLDS